MKSSIIASCTRQLTDLGNRGSGAGSRERYAAAVVFSAVFLLIGVGLNQAFGDEARPSTLLVLSVVATTWYGGIGPGLFALGLGFALSSLFLVPPYFRPTLDAVTLIRFSQAGVVAVLTASLYEALRESRRTQAHLREEVISRDEFVSFVSHELKTPATILIGNARLLLKETSGTASALVEESAEAINTEARRLTSIIDNLLVLSRSGGLENKRRGRVAPAVVLSTAISEHGSRFPGRPILANFPSELPPVHINGEHLRIVARNLLENAEKYSPKPSSPIEIDAQQVGAEVIVQVKDRGIGIREEDAAQLFNAFFRGADAREVHTGYGLGLAVCARVVSEAGGRIWAAPRVDGGSVFSFAVAVAVQTASHLAADS